MKADDRDRCEALTCTGQRCRQQPVVMVSEAGREYRVCSLHARQHRFDGTFRPATSGQPVEVDRG